MNMNSALRLFFILALSTSVSSFCYSAELSESQKLTRISGFISKNSIFKNVIKKIHDKINFVALNDTSLNTSQSKSVALLLLQLGLMPSDPIDDPSLLIFLEEYFNQNALSVNKISAYTILWSYLYRGIFLYSLIYPNELSPEILTGMIDLEIKEIAQNIDEKVVPYESARVDLFKQYSIHGIELEYSVVSINDKLKAIGRISTSSVTVPHDRLTYSRSLHEYVNTADGKWKIILTKIDKTNKGGDQMPYCFMLSYGCSVEGSGRGFHGTIGYGKGSFGYPASHGCIRLCDGFEKLKWKLLNPTGLNFSLYVGYDEAEFLASFAALLVMREKIEITVYSKKGLDQNPNLKAALEERYSKETILSAVKKQRPGYKDFSEE